VGQIYIIVKTSRASAEQFVGSRDLVEFTLVLVGTQFKRVLAWPTGALEAIKLPTVSL